MKKKLLLYQKGIILGFLLPILSILFGFVGSKAFHFSNFSKVCDLGGSPLILLHIFILPNCFGLLLWPILGGLLGLLLQSVYNSRIIFSIFKIVLGLPFIILGGIFIYFPFHIFDLDIKSLFYFGSMFFIALAFISTGILIIRTN